MLAPPGPLRPLNRVLVLVVGCVFLLACSNAPAAPGPQSYLACGCGCCVSDTFKPQKRCLFRSRGDDLARIIAEDQRMAANTKACAVAGCSAGIEYVYCDE